MQFAAVKELEPTLTYEAINNKQVDVIMAFSTDGRIPAYHLALLLDDQHLFPPYDCAPLLRQATLQAHPELAKILQPLAGLIDDRTMQQLNAEVDLAKHSPYSVAHEFLRAKNLVN